MNDLRDYSLEEGDFCTARDTNGEAVSGNVECDHAGQPVYLRLSDSHALLVDITRLSQIKVAG